jgi:hypothetical protein
MNVDDDTRCNKVNKKMDHDSPESENLHPPPRLWRWARVLLVMLVLYLLVAYLVMPLVWRVHVHRHPSIDDNPRITQTSDGHPGDPLNVAVIGTTEQVDRIMQNAKWYPAAALGLKSDLKIAVDTVMSRPDDEAPVSSLFLFGRKEDLAFEQPVGHNPRQRHHVRFWKAKNVDNDGRPIWIGSATYDERVGLSHTTGQITHHIAADVDAERDHLLDNLKQTGQISEQFYVDDFHKQRQGRNGGGDRWHTDGKLAAAVIADKRP